MIIKKPFHKTKFYKTNAQNSAVFRVFDYSFHNCFILIYQAWKRFYKKEIHLFRIFGREEESCDVKIL